MRRQLSRDDAAIEDQSKAIALDGRFRDALYERALCFTTVENFSAATADLQAIVQFYPYDLNAWQKLAQAYLKQGQDAQALKVRRKITDLDPYTN